MGSTDQPQIQAILTSGRFFSQEFVNGQGVGLAADWWAVGIMVFELMVGLPPFHSLTISETKKRFEKEAWRNALGSEGTLRHSKSLLKFSCCAVFKTFEILEILLSCNKISSRMSPLQTFQNTCHHLIFRASLGLGETLAGTQMETTKNNYRL